jgi:Na+/H+ antiporter NhaA
MIATSWTPRALGMMSRIRTFLRLGSARGIPLILAAGLAIICANTSLKHLYESLLEIPVYVPTRTMDLARFTPAKSGFL